MAFIGPLQASLGWVKGLGRIKAIEGWASLGSEGGERSCLEGVSARLVIGGRDANHRCLTSRHFLLTHPLLHKICSVQIREFFRLLQW